MDSEIKEELRRVFVIYRDGKAWSEHGSREEAEAALANIERNETWMHESAKQGAGEARAGVQQTG